VENLEIHPTLNGQAGKGFVEGGTVSPSTTTDLFPERDCQMSAETKVVTSAAKRIRDGNPEPRIPCVLLLDVSGSMSGDKITELNKGLVTLRNELLKDEQVARRVELAIVTFGGSVQVAQDFVTPSEFKPPVLTVKGDTPMAAGVLKAFELVEQRQARYEASDLDSYEPWIFMVSDGEPTDEDKVLSDAHGRIASAERRERGKRIAFFAVGVEGANMKRLATLSKRTPLKLKEMSFGRMFYWISESLKDRSRKQIGERVSLTNPIADGWAEV
jgi:uncharacterized protein YegL